MLGPGWGELVAFIRELVSLLCGGIYESLIAFPRCCLEPWVGPWLLASAPLAAAGRSGQWLLQDSIPVREFLTLDCALRSRTVLYLDPDSLSFCPISKGFQPNGPKYDTQTASYSLCCFVLNQTLHYLVQTGFCSFQCQIEKQ